MTYEEFASDLPVSRTIVFTSVEENEEAFSRYGVEQPMRQLGKGAYRSDLAVRSTEQADLYADRYNKAISMYLEAPKGSVGLLFPRSANGQFLACGQNLTNENLLEATITCIGYSSGQRLPERLFTNAGRINVAKLAQEFIEKNLSGLSETDLLNVLQTNAAKLYNVTL